jgi:hypothetical protein
MSLQKRHELSLMEYQCSCKLRLIQGLQEPFKGEWVAQWTSEAKAKMSWRLSGTNGKGTVGKTKGDDAVDAAVSEML